MIQSYLNNGWRLVPLHEYQKGWELAIKPKSSKAPSLLKGWQLIANTITSIDQLPPGNGVGLAHAYSGTMSLDIDNWIESDKLLKPQGVDLQQLYDACDSVSINSGRENRGKLLYAMPLGVVLPTQKITYQDATNCNKMAYELRCGTKNGLTTQDVLPPSIHPETGVPYSWAGNGHYSNLPIIPPELLTLWQSLLVEKSISTTTTTTPTDANWDDILEALNFISPDSSRVDWLKVAMALHDIGHRTNNMKFALSTFNGWSAQSKTKYKGSTDILSTWRSLNPGKGIGVGTLLHLAAENGWSRKTPDASDMFAPVNATQPVTYKSLTKDIALNTSPWFKSWVFLASHDAYIDVDVMQPISTLAFNNMNNYRIPPGPKGGRQSASNYATSHNLIENVYHKMYLPHIKEMIVAINGVKVMNSFRLNSVPKTADGYTQPGLEAIQLLVNHINYICHDNIEYANTLIHWIAHQVQNPGVLLRWCPIIQGEQGSGKSFFRDLLIQILGDTNVGVVAPAQITSDFNGWATGHMVSSLEELRLSGKNRYGVLNALNPLITDNKIQINEKNVKAYTVSNVTNYICFTNYRDAIPVHKNARRWWIMFTPSEIKDSNYYISLIHAINTYYSEIRKSFLEIEIPKEFANLTRAPDTEFKNSMIRTEEANVEGLTEIKILIDEGGMYFNKDYIASSYLFEQFRMTYPEIPLNDRKKNILLTKLGYGSVTNQMKITPGKVSKVWSKGTGEPNNIEIRASWKLTNPFKSVTPEINDNLVINFN